MAENYMKQNECFEKDYDKLYSKGSWTKDDLEMMKDLKKLMYYNLVIEAMENGSSYPGSEGMGDMSFARGRSPMTGRYVSRDMGRGNSSGMYYPGYMDGYGNSWDGNTYNGSYNGSYNGGSYNGNNGGMNQSGRRYYESEKENAIHKLHHMMENEDNAEKKKALKLAITELEQK